MNPESYITVIGVKLIDVKSFHHALNESDTTRNLNEFLEKCKFIPFMLFSLTDFK